MRRPRPQLAPPALLLALSLSLTPAARADWEPTAGPSGATVLSAVRTPAGALLVGTLSGGLYRSADGGGSWGRSETGLTWPCCNFDLPSLASNGGTLVYAGTWGGGVFLSEDDGQTWAATGTLPGDGYPIVMALAACPRGDGVIAGGNFGVARSDDRGATWTDLSSGLSSDWVRSLARLGNTLYAVNDLGVFRLAEGASAWTPFADGLPGTAGVRSVALVEGTVTLATHEGGVYVLGCDGAAWTPLNAGVETDHVEVLVSAGSDLVAGLMGGGVRRLAGGYTAWEPLGTGLWNDDVRVLTTLGATPVAGTYGAGVFGYDALSDAWTELNNGIVAPPVRRLAADGTHLYAGVFGGGVAHSADLGQTWTRSVEGLGNPSVMDVVARPGVVFAATWNGVYRSTDQGQHWTPSGLQTHGVFRLRDLSDGLYAGTFDAQVWRSTDGGLTWVQRGGDLPRLDIRGIERLGSAVYVSLDGMGVVALPDTGTVWASAATGLPTMEVRELAVSNGRMLVGTIGAGVWRWVPASSSWVASGLDGSDVHAFGSMGAGLFAGLRGAVWSTTDGGDTWSDVSAGTPPYLVPTGFAQVGSSVFSAVEGMGVCRLGGVAGVPADDHGLAGRALVAGPNPARSSTLLRFRSPGRAPVRLEVLDAAGRRVATLVSGVLPPGVYERAWDGRDVQGRRVPAGVYLVRLEAGTLRATAKVALTH